MIFSIYITKEQYILFQNEVNRLAIEYDKTRDQNKIHKYLPHAFVNNRIEIQFVNGHVVNGSHNGKILGKVSTIRKHVDDIEYPIHKALKFNEYRYNKRNFILSIAYVGDGLIDSHTAIVYDKHGKKLEDFTNYNSLYD
jgi:hypothetical protein